MPRFFSCSPTLLRRQCKRVIASKIVATDYNSSSDNADYHTLLPQLTNGSRCGNSIIDSRHCHRLYVCVRLIVIVNSSVQICNSTPNVKKRDEWDTNGRWRGVLVSELAVCRKFRRVYPADYLSSWTLSSLANVPSTNIRGTYQSSTHAFLNAVQIGE